MDFLFASSWEFQTKMFAKSPFGGKKLRQIILYD